MITLLKYATECLIFHPGLPHIYMWPFLTTEKFCILVLQVLEYVWGGYVAPLGWEERVGEGRDGKKGKERESWGKERGNWEERRVR